MFLNISNCKFLPRVSHSYYILFMLHLFYLFFILQGLKGAVSVRMKFYGVSIWSRLYSKNVCHVQKACQSRAIFLFLFSSLGNSCPCVAAMTPVPNRAVASGAHSSSGCSSTGLGGSWSVSLTVKALASRSVAGRCVLYAGVLRYPLKLLYPWSYSYLQRILAISLEGLFKDAAKASSWMRTHVPDSN